MNSQRLFTPLTIHNTTFKNRIFLPSMVTHFCAINGEMSDRLIAYHAARAKGGVGLNMLESSAVDAAGKSYWPGVSIADDSTIKGLRKLTAAIHAHGGKAGVQINHAGRLAQPAVSGRARQLVSAVPGRTPFEDSQVMDEEDIQTVITHFCDAASRAVEAGFDVVEIHGAHGYLIAQFMSPLFNRREDAYGGSFENRMRMPLAVVEGIRKRVGPNFPLFFRCSVDEFLAGGLDLEQAVCVAEAVVNSGVDVFNVSVGLGETNHFTGPPPCIPAGWNADRAAAVKAAVGQRAAVAVAGRIVDRESAEAILGADKADLVAMGRALIADPDLPAKLEAGLDSTVLRCVGCNDGCVSRLREKKAITCAVNPLVGREMRFPNVPASTRRTVCVVGGGPAGMQAALTAANRGHEVTLYEKGEALGGLAHVAALPPHKALYADLVRHQTAALAAAGVIIRTERAFTVEDARTLRPDVLLVATGSEPILPGFCASYPGLLTAEAVLRGAPVGKNTLIVGGGMVGCETAEFLTLRGVTVTVLEMRPELAPDMQARARKFLLQSLKDHGVTTLTSTELLTLEPEGVTIRDTYGNTRRLAAFDTVIAAVGYRPQNTLCAELAAAGLPFTALGDCHKVGKIMDAVNDAFETAYLADSL